MHAYTGKHKSKDSEVESNSYFTVFLLNTKQVEKCDYIIYEYVYMIFMESIHTLKMLLFVFSQIQKHRNHQLSVVTLAIEKKR